MFKRFFSLILALVLCASSAATLTYALDDDIEYALCEVSFKDAFYLNQRLDSSLLSDSEELLYNNIMSALNDMLTAIKNFETTSDISKYNIPTYYSGALFSTVFLYNPHLFYLNPSCSYSYYPVAGTIAEMVFSYAYTPAEYAARKQIFDYEIYRIISSITPQMSDLEKALIVHDYLDLHCEYDTEKDENGEYKTSSYRADGIIVEKTGVCQSYSLAYYYIMSILGIDVDYAESSDMNHIWNILKIGDYWYHTDLTWDDPVPDGFAYVTHQHFLASDTLIGSEDNKHYNWVSNYDCPDTSLDNEFWRNITGAIAFDGNDYAYYHDGFDIVKHSLSSGSTDVLQTIKDPWYIWDTAAYSDVLFYNNKLYYNTPLEIKEMNTDGSEHKTIASYNGGDGYIYGSMLTDYNLLFGVSTTPKGECAVYYTPLENRIGVLVDSETPTAISISVLRKFFDYSNIPGQIIATLYDENDIVTESKIFDLSSCNITDSSSTFTVDFDTDTGSYIKLMWWDSGTLAPVALNRTVNITQ